MALFGKSSKPKQADAAASDVRPVMGREASCMVCRERRIFTRCWLRVNRVTTCQCCGQVFENPGAIYKSFQPKCPRCGEYLEQPGFEYGLCDTCGSKHELIEGTKPGLLPNLKQRQAMEQVGKSWSRD